MIEKVEKREWLQHLSAAGRAHQPRDRAVRSTTGSSQIARAGLGVGDLAEARVMGPFEKRGSRAVAAQVAGQDALARAAFKAAVHHSRSSIIASAGFPNSANPASTSPPW